MSSYFRGVLAALIVASAAATASAQQAAPPAPAPTYSVKWNNGLSLESSDGDNKFQIGTLIQADGRFVTDDPPAIADTFLLRRARIILQGRVQKYFEFYLLPDFAGSAITLFDAYIDTKFSNALRIRTGKSKAPLGLETLYSDANIPFAERSVANNLAPNRDVGVDAMGDLFKGHFSYVGGLRNGVPDAANGDTDTNGGKDLVGRATVRFGPVGAAVGGTHGKETGALPSFKSTAQQTFFSYATGVTANGERNRVSPSVFGYYKWFGGFAEYFRTTQAIAKGTTTGDVSNTGWQVTGILVATGEALSDRGAGAPKKPFDPAKNHWGGLQIAARVASLSVDSQAFARALQAAGSSQYAKASGVSVTWYNNSNVKHILTYEHTVFDHDANGTRKAENAIIFRVQVNLAPAL